MTWRLAFRNIFRHRTRSLITMGAIAFGCTAIIFVGGFFEDMFWKMRESYIKGHTGHIQIYRAGFFEHGSGRPYEYLIEHPQALIPLIQRLEGVKSVAQRLEFSGLISTGENTVACIAQGIEPRYEPTVRLNEVVDPRADLPASGGSVIESGQPLTDQEPYDVILGRGLAGGLGASVNGNLILVTHTIGGTINALDLNVRGIFYTSSKAFDDRALRLPLVTAQQLLHTDAVQSLVILLQRTEDTARIAKTLQQIFQDQHLELELRTWDQISDFYQKTRALFGRMFLVLKFVIAIIVILSIYNTMNMAVIERTKEIGTMMAIGTPPQEIIRLFLAEGLLLGVLGGAAGALLGIVATATIRFIGIPMPPPPGATMTWLAEPLIVPSVLVFAFVLSVVTAVVSSSYPAYNASRLEIAQALRHV